VPMNFRLEIGENPRDLEKQQIVKLMNIIAEEIFEGQYDFDFGTDKIEEKLRKGENIPDGHLRATRMSKEEVIYNWLRYVHQLIKRFYLMDGKVIDDDELFERKLSQELWNLIRKLIKNLAALPVWVNPAVSSTVFRGKQDNDFWKLIFDTGKTEAGQQVLAKPLNLDDLIS
jgi:hypothetical protein